jgi:hypothetical protein
VTLQIVRDWVLKLNAHGPDGLIDRKPPGQPSRARKVLEPARCDLIRWSPQVRRRTWRSGGSGKSN